MYEYVPLARNDESIVCQYTMVTLEELGLLKMDFLGLRNLTVLDDAIKMLPQSEHFDLLKIPMDDPQVFQMLTQARPPVCSSWNPRHDRRVREPQAPEH